jgi:hypothetical protein
VCVACVMSGMLYGDVCVIGRACRCEMVNVGFGMAAMLYVGCSCRMLCLSGMCDWLYL